LLVRYLVLTPFFTSLLGILAAIGPKSGLTYSFQRYGFTHNSVLH